LSQWRKDLRTGALVLLLLVTVSVLPWVWYGGICRSRQQERQVAVMGVPEVPCIAITFDDGPRRETTGALLDGLARRGVHATFFLVGTRIAGQEDLILRMAAEGHQVGIHSQNHKVLADLGRKDLEVEVTTVERTLSALLGEQTFMLRPPYGLTGEVLLRWADNPIILWSVDPEDWSDRDTKRQVAQVVEQAEDGDIILLHDIYWASVDTALQAVDALMAKGFRFVTVEELFLLRGIKAEAGCEYRSLPPEQD